jgi:hypothetical protein
MRLAILVLTMMWAMPAAGQQGPCGERSKVLNQLRQSYQEAPVALGVMGDGNLLELAVSHTGSWTIVVTRPDNRTCAIAAGEKWVRMHHKLEDPSRSVDF